VFFLLDNITLICGSIWCLLSCGLQTHFAIPNISLIQYMNREEEKTAGDIIIIVARSWMSHNAMYVG
jgi:hypothetical protein